LPVSPHVGESLAGPLPTDAGLRIAHVAEAGSLRRFYRVADDLGWRHRLPRPFDEFLVQPAPASLPCSHCSARIDVRGNCSTENTRFVLQARDLSHRRKPAKSSRGPSTLPMTIGPD